MYFWYILKKYVKNFFVFFVALVLLYAVVDVMFNISKLPKSSNMFVLYLFYVGVYSSFLLYPLAMVFSFLFTLSQMIKFNELVSFYSLGFKPKMIIKPFLVFAFFLFLLFSVLQFTKLAYSYSYALSIKNKNKLATKEIFLRFKNKIVFIKTLDPVLQKAYDMRVFYINNRDLSRVIFAKEAFFKDDRWYSKEAKILILNNSKWETKFRDIVFLQNFKPKIISNLQKLRDISFYDAFLVLKYFKNVDYNKILSLVFFKIFTPLLMILVIIDIFIKSPIHVRLSNISLFMIKSILFAVFMWGSELLIFKFAKQGVIPFYILSLPFVVLLIKIFFDLRRSNGF